MDDLARKFLNDLLMTPGVSGYETGVQEVVRRFVEPFADSVRSDLHGNLIAADGAKSPIRVMLAGHCDQIGMLVSQIDENGFVYTQTVGGWDPLQLVGQNVVVWTESGPVPGVISRKAIHLQDEDERKQLVKVNELWIDCGIIDGAECKKMIRIGDPVTLRLGYQALCGNAICGPAMDNRVGVWVVMEVFRRWSRQQGNVALYSVSTVQEEIGLRGSKTAAFGIDPQIGVAVDVTHATDCPEIDRRQQGEIRLGKGPVIFRGPNINARISQRLIEIAAEQDIPHQLAALGKAASNDSNSLQISRAGVATGLVSIPNRYMHSPVETVSLDDLSAAVDLISCFVQSITSVDEFIP
jgi:endoglucanase